MDGATGVEHLLDQLEHALEEGNVTDAQKTFRSLREELDKQNAWQWLRENEPEDMGELIGKLNLILDQDQLAQSRESVVRQLIKIFEWCRDQGFSVEQLRPKDNLHK